MKDMPRLRGNSVEIATNEIIRKIDNFDFCTGDVVSDADLAKELGISRTPVREAMQQLISAGLLERKATHVIVKAITISDIIEILQVRECMECKSVELILVDKGLLQSQIEELRTVNQELSKNVANGDFDSNFSSDEVFHKKILQYAGNTRFLDINSRMRRQSDRLRWISVLTPWRYTETVQEHENIIDCLARKDLKGSQEAVRKHLKMTEDNYRQILENSQWDKMLHELNNMRVAQQQLKKRNSTVYNSSQSDFNKIQTG